MLKQKTLSASVLLVALASHGADAGLPADLYVREATWQQTLATTRARFQKWQAEQIAAGKPQLKPYQSDILKAGQAAQQIAVDVKGWNRLVLAAEGIPTWAWGHAIWADPVLVDKDGKKTELWQVKPSEIKVGWGESLVDKTHLGPLLIANKKYEHGFFAHAHSRIVFELGAQYTRFEASIGVGDTAARDNGQVIFRVLPGDDAAAGLWQRFAADFPREARVVNAHMGNRPESLFTSAEPGRRVRTAIAGIFQQLARDYPGFTAVSRLQGEIDAQLKDVKDEAMDPQLTALMRVNELSSALGASRIDITANWHEGDGYLPHIQTRQPPLNWKEKEMRVFRQTLALAPGDYRITVHDPRLKYHEGRPADWQGTIKAGDGEPVDIRKQAGRLDFTVVEGQEDVTLELRHSLARPVRTELIGTSRYAQRPLTYAVQPTGGSHVRMQIHGLPFLVATERGKTAFPINRDLPCHGAAVKTAHFLGMIHSIDIGNGSWYSPKGDHSRSHFVGDKAGSIEIKWSDGETTSVPIIFGFNLWWSRPWDMIWHNEQFGQRAGHLDRQLFGGTSGDAFRDDLQNGVALVDGVRPLGYTGSERRFIFSLDLGGRAVDSIRFGNVRELQGQPVVSAVTLETAKPATELAPLPALSGEPAKLKTVSLGDVASKTYEPGVRKIMQAFYTFVDELPKLTEPEIPDGYFGPRYDFRGPAEAIYAACFLYRNGPECGAHVPDSGVTCNSPTASGRLVGLYTEGMGVWWLNQPLFGSVTNWFKLYQERSPGSLKGRGAAWTRGVGALVREAKAFGYGKYADSYIDWLDNCLLTEAKPPHWNRIAGSKQFTGSRRVGDFVEEGNRENDGHGICMWGRYMAWYWSGRPKDWNEKRWKATEAAVNWIQWQLDTEKQFPNRGKDVLYTESECAPAGYDIYSSYNCLHGLKLSIRMAEQLGKTETVAKWQALHERLRQGILKHLVDKPGIWHTERNCHWQDLAHAMVPITLASDGDSFTPLQDYAKGDETDRKYLEISRATYRHLMQSKNYNCIRMYGYGQGYMTQAALLLDEMTDVEGFVNMLVRHAYLPHMAGWACPEGIILHRSGKYYLPVNGYAGQDIHVAEATKAMRLMLGVDDNDPDHTRFVPRYPSSWTQMSIADFPVLTGAKRQKCSYTYARAADKQMFSFTFEEPVSRASVRLGPLPEGRTVQRILVNGKNAEGEILASGDSTWVWIHGLNGKAGSVIAELKDGE